MATGAAFTSLEMSYNLLNSQIIYDIKVERSYVARDLEHKMFTAGSTSLEESYKLSDSKIITFNNKRFRCPEAFESSFLAMEASNINETTLPPPEADLAGSPRWTFLGL